MTIDKFNFSPFKSISLWCNSSGLHLAWLVYSVSLSTVYKRPLFTGISYLCNSQKWFLGRVLFPGAMATKCQERLLLVSCLAMWNQKAFFFTFFSPDSSPSCSCVAKKRGLKLPQIWVAALYVINFHLKMIQFFDARIMCVTLQVQFLMGTYAFFDSDSRLQIKRPFPWCSTFPFQVSQGVPSGTVSPVSPTQMPTAQAFHLFQLAFSEPAKAQANQTKGWNLQLQRRCLLSQVRRDHGPLPGWRWVSPNLNS